MDSAGIGFLRSTAERAGSLALAAPRSASTHLARWIMNAADSISSRTGTEAATATGTGTGTVVTTAATTPSLPSPVTYLTSAYLVTSLALAFLLHRIHHLVPPRLHPAPGGAMHRQHQRVMQPLVQVGCRGPGIALLASAVIALLAQILHPVADANHPALLWQCYLAVCATVTGETFVRALSDDLPHAHHQFNLLSFSFLLHVHSASSTTTGNHSELYTYLLITLGEILALQITYCAPHLPLVNKLDQAYRSRFAPLSPGVNNRSASMRRIYRLPITALCSLTAQYFALRSWSRVFSSSSPRSTAADHNNSKNNVVVGEAEEFGTVWLNKVPELVLEFIVGTSVALKFLAAVIRGEELSMENLVGPAALTPRPEDDYAVALIKYATHLLSTTRLSGLAHELSPLEILPSSVSSSLETLGFLEPPPCDSEDCPVHGAENRMAAREADELVRNGGRGQEVVLQRNGDVVFWDLIPLDGHGNPVVVGSASEGAFTPPPPGFMNEIRRVSVESPFGAPQVDADGSYAAADGSWTGNSGAVPSFSSPFSRRMAHVEGERKSALWRLVGLLCRIAVYVVWRGWRGVRWAVRGVAARVLGGSRRIEWELERRWRSEEGREVREREMDAREGDAPSRTTTTTRRSQSMTPNAEGWAVGTAGSSSSSGRQFNNINAAEDEDDDGGEWLPEGVVSGSEEDDGGEWDDEEEDGDDDDMPAVRTETEIEDGEDEDDLGGTNPLVLYSDLVSQPARHPQQQQQQQQSSPPASEGEEDLAPYLLAHHLAPSRAGPLTRRRYRALLPPSPSPSPSSSSSQSQQQTTGGGMAALSSAIDHRRAQVIEMARRQGQGGGGGGGGGEVDVARWMEEEREKWREGKSRFCVVCTVEERTVVLWPCRCLCLCEACRAALAERTTSAVFDDGAGAAGGSGAGGQLCPTCRTPVQGFSRIFTP